MANHVLFWSSVVLGLVHLAAMGVWHSWQALPFLCTVYAVGALRVWSTH